jgi:hypothetical protein
MRQPARQSVVEHKTCCENCDIPYAVTYVTKESHLSKMLCQPRLVRRGASILSVVGAYYSLVVSLVFSFSVMRRFPAEVLATYTVLNAGFSMASVMLGYATVGIRYIY